MIPALVAAAAAKTLGGVIGGIGQTQDITKGMNAYRENVNKGTDVLNAGRAGADTAFTPYTTAGATAVGGELNAIQNRQMAPQPTATNTSAAGIQDWLNPMAQWQQNQATKAGTAAGIATGATGGGMQRALSNNASKMAAGSWNDAYKQMLDANTQNFGQGQQLYENKTGFDQSQIQNYGNLAQRGMQAVGNNQQIDYNYNTGVNQNYGDIAANEMAGWGNKGQVFNDASTATGNNLAGGITSIFGKK